MSVILILLSASLTIAVGFLIAFIWSVKNGQYDDDYTPSVRMLFDNDPVVNADASARDVEGLALSGFSGRKSRNEVEPVAARPHEAERQRQNSIGLSLRGEAPK